MSSISQFRAIAFAAATATLGTTGCIDKEKCDEAIRVTRDAIAKEQGDLARQWRNRAWTMCEDAATVANLDQEIVAKEAEIKKRAEDAAKKIAEAAKKRMNKAQKVWKSFDALEDDDKTLERLEKHQDKAERMAKGLPAEYAQQVEDYNEKQFDRRKDKLDDDKK